MGTSTDEVKGDDEMQRQGFGLVKALVLVLALGASGCGTLPTPGAAPLAGGAHLLGDNGVGIARAGAAVIANNGGSIAAPAR